MCARRAVMCARRAVMCARCSITGWAGVSSGAIKLKCMHEAKGSISSLHIRSQPA